MNRFPKCRQGGAALLIMVTGVLLVAVTTLVMNQAKMLRDSSSRTRTTRDNQEVVRKALVNFLTINGRLPCPADGAIADEAANAGVERRNGVTGACTTTNAVVPWVTLGIPLAAGLDGWNNRISYRVFQSIGLNNTGLTIDNGADMSNCDTAPPTPVAATAPSYLCTSTHTTSGSPVSSTGFLGAYRSGFQLNDLTAGTVRQVGFVLISHGATGYGAWTPGGAQPYLPAAGNVAESANAQVSTIYYRQAFSDTTILPTANNHFDDEVVYMTIPDLVKAAGRAPRKWTVSTPIAGPTTPVGLDNATFAANGVAFAGLSSNSSLITLIPGTVSTPMIISTGPGYVIARNAAGTAIGVCVEAPAVCNNLTAQLVNPEYLSFLLTTQTAQKVSLGLLNYGAGESLQIVFRKLGVPVGDPVLVSYPALPAGLFPTTGLGAAFDEVIVTPQGASAIFIQSIQFCDAASAC